MNDNFSFDGADAADMPLDLSFSSLPLPEGEAAAGFHLPEMTPAQEQAKADSPKLVDEWRQDVQMLDDGGLNGLEERAGLEAGFPWMPKRRRKKVPNPSIPSWGIWIPCAARGPC